jgi:hypothetical protein
MPCMQPPTVELYRPKVVMNPSSPDERGLVAADKGIHEWCEPQRQPFGDQLAEAVNEADRLVVPETGWCFHFARQYNGSIIGEVEAPPVLRPQCVESIAYVILDHQPRGAVKSPREPVRLGHTIGRSRADDFGDLVLRKFCSELLEVEPGQVQAL